MISFYIKGGEMEAFKFLNHLQLIKLAVSLESTESLVQYPTSITHSGICPKLKKKIGIEANLIRLSIGIENYNDLIWDINQALNSLEVKIQSKKDNNHFEKRNSAAIH